MIWTGVIGIATVNRVERPGTRHGGVESGRERERQGKRERGKGERGRGGGRRPQRET